MRSRSMQKLTDALKRKYPGIVIYGIGDAAHKLRTSDHNEDDTSGSRAAQSDPDSNPEHRALDLMISSRFTVSDANRFITNLLGSDQGRAHTYYLIFQGWLYSRTYGWVRRRFDGDPHNDHIHLSGWAPKDESNYDWEDVVEGDEVTRTDIDQIATAVAKRLHDLDLGEKGGPTWAQTEQLTLSTVTELAKAVSALRTEVSALAARIK